MIWVFSQTVIQKHDIGYFRCSRCLSLQTEYAFWLEEAYSNSLSALDTFAVQRNLQNLAVCFVVSKLYKIRNVIDFGGGDGLLCRLLRDYGLNCYVQDKYAVPKYAQGFVEPDFERADMVVAFEVLEHLPSPGGDLEGIFRLDAKVVVVSTEIYTHQGGDWEYLAPESGQHIFFYSRRALHLIAQRYGYRITVCGPFVVYVKPTESVIKDVIAKVLLNRVILRVVRSIVVILPASNVWNDHLLLKAKLRNNVKRGLG